MADQNTTEMISNGSYGTTNDFFRIRKDTGKQMRKTSIRVSPYDTILLTERTHHTPDNEQDFNKTGRHK